MDGGDVVVGATVVDICALVGDATDALPNASTTASADCRSRKLIRNRNDVEDGENAQTCIVSPQIQPQRITVYKRSTKQPLSIIDVRTSV